MNKRIVSLLIFIVAISNFISAEENISGIALFSGKTNFKTNYPYDETPMWYGTHRRFGLRFEFNVSSYYYGKKTSQWLGQHGGPAFNFGLVYDKFTLGVRFKPWTVNPGKELIFDNTILPLYADVNPIKIDYYLGYSFDFIWGLSAEPYLGYNRSSFHVINQDELKQAYFISKTGGLITGATLNKYIRLAKGEYITIFANIGYGFVNYEKVHPELDNGYFEWAIGLAFKGFFISKETKKTRW